MTVSLTTASTASMISASFPSSTALNEPARGLSAGNSDKAASRHIEAAMDARLITLPSDKRRETRKACWRTGREGLGRNAESIEVRRDPVLPCWQQSVGIIAYYGTVGNSCQRRDRGSESLSGHGRLNNRGNLQQTKGEFMEEY